MLKKLAKFIRRKLEARKIERENRRIGHQLEQHRKDWAQIMRSGGAVRDDEVLMDYSDGRTRQRCVTPRFVRPFGMGRDKL